MNAFIGELKGTLKHEEARYTYADSLVNAFVSAQIKALREDRELSQHELAELIGTKQSGISRLEKADYSTWKIETLRKLARAFGVRLRISFDEFATLPPDVRGFSKKRLCPRPFAKDPVFGSNAGTSTRAAKAANIQANRDATVGKGHGVDMTRRGVGRSVSHAQEAKQMRNSEPQGVEKAELRKSPRADQIAS